MIRTVEIRETFPQPGCYAETLKRYTADDIKVQISGEELMVFVSGNVKEEKK